MSNLHSIREKIEQIVKKTGYPVAYKGCWEDQPIKYVVRGKDSFITLDIKTSKKGSVHLYRQPLNLKRENKKFFIKTKGMKYTGKELISYGRGYVDEKKQSINYANIYKWLLKNKPNLMVWK